MSGAILDSSALIALLRSEPGGDKVHDILAGAQMSAVNYAEVASHFVHVGMPADAVNIMLKPLPIVIVDADADLALKAGEFRGMTAEAGLSLGDRFCLALAWRENASAWTADRQWAAIASRIGVDVVVIR